MSTVSSERRPKWNCWPKVSSL